MLGEIYYRFYRIYIRKSTRITLEGILTLIHLIKIVNFVKLKFFNCISPYPVYYIFRLLRTYCKR